MGDAADSMLNGLLCEQCGVLIDGDEPGYPHKCKDCRPKRKPKRRRRTKQRPEEKRR